MRLRSFSPAASPCFFAIADSLPGTRWWCWALSRWRWPRRGCRFPAYIDDRAYDWMFLRQPPTPWPTSSIILGIDEVTFEKMDGQSHMRRIIAEGLERIHDGGPKAVAIDVILSDDPNSPENAALQAAFAKTRNLVLSSDRIASTDRWEDPLPLFRRDAAALGHVHRLTNSVCRSIQLRQVAGRVRRWALALEAFRLARGAQYVTESRMRFR